MTLPSSGAISLNDIAAEFGIANSTPFPNGFYGLGGAPGSGALSFFDFYGRSSITLSADRTSLLVYGNGQTQQATITASGPTTFSFTGTTGLCTGSQINSTTALVRLTTPATGSGSTGGTVRVSAASGPYIDITFSGNWDGGGGGGGGQPQ